MRVDLLASAALALAASASISTALAQGSPVFRVILLAEERSVADDLEGALAFEDVEGALFRSTIVSNAGTVGGTPGTARTVRPLGGTEAEVCGDASCATVLRPYSAEVA